MWAGVPESHMGGVLTGKKWKFFQWGWGWGRGFQQGRGRTGLKLFQHGGLASEGQQQWEEKINFNQTSRFGENWIVHPVYQLDRRFKQSNPGSIPLWSNCPNRTGIVTGRSGPVFKTIENIHKSRTDIGNKISV